MKMKFLGLLAIAFLMSLGLKAQEGRQTELSEKLKQHVKILASDSLEGRGLGTEGRILAQNYIAGHFKEIGLTPYNDEGYFQHFDLRINLVHVSGANVVGYLKGSDPDLKDEYILIGAHYDHLGYRKSDDEKVIFHGADDNASGVATVIELARYFASNPGLVKRSIIFIAFDAEESGLLGSGKFVSENKIFDVNEIVAMFSLDMVGMYKANKGLDFKGLGTLNGGNDLAQPIVLAQGLILKNTSAKIEAQTDTWPFGEKGIPAIHAFTSTKSPYHKPEDTFEKLDYEGMAKITTFMQAVITEMLSIPEIVPSKRFERLQKPYAVHFNTGVTAGLGSSRHKYPDEFYIAKSVFALNAGLFVQMHIGDKLTLQPEVLLQLDGSKSAEGHFSRQSVIIPVNLHFNLVNQYGGMFKVYPFAGAYFRNSFGGKNGGDELDFDEIYNKQEWGLNLGLGTDLMKWQIKLTGQRSLTNLLQTSENEIIPMGWYFSVGYKF
jgi:hypothetical protein